jgi:hypothetical protein
VLVSQGLEQLALLVLVVQLQEPLLQLNLRLLVLVLHWLRVLFYRKETL